MVRNKQLETVYYLHLAADSNDFTITNCLDKLNVNGLSGKMFNLFNKQLVAAGCSCLLQYL